MWMQILAATPYVAIGSSFLLAGSVLGICCSRPAHPSDRGFTALR